jgi:hypothetical protein
MNNADVFSQSYVQARGKFLAAAAQAALPVESHAHPFRGRDGEPLAMDVVRAGARDAKRLFILSSACHGVEGYCGSGVQVALLEDAAFAQAAQAAGVAVLYIHGLNPYGFSWWRRVTHENVDLNRNFINFAAPLPRNDAYTEVAELVLPAVWPPDAANTAAVQQVIATRGMKFWQAAITGGQYHQPEGLFHGGQAPTWSNATVRQVLRDHARACTDLAWVDVHTGLGPAGHGERIFAGRNNAEQLARSRAWWGAEVTSIYEGSSSSALLNGMMCFAVDEECPQARYGGIAMEYGTQPMEAVLNAMRAEQWLQLRPNTDESTRAAIKQQMRDAFYVDTPEWKAAILRQGREVAMQAVEGLARSG